MRHAAFCVLVASLVLVGAGCASTKKPAKVVEDATIAVAMTVTENTIIPAGSKVEVGETIGCNDRVIMVNVPRQSNKGDVMTDALTALFAVGDNHDGWQNNALSASRLVVEKTQSRDGVTTEVWLKGTISSGGVCDDPRIKAQIEKTIGRYINKYEVYLNGSAKNWRCFGDQSGKCK